MKVRVAFTVEFDEKAYKENIGDESQSKTDVRYEVKAKALESILFGLGDDGVEVKLISEDK